MLSVKNIIRGTLLTVLMVGLAYGQGMTGKGAMVGLNLATVGGSDAKDPDPKTKIGFALGGYADFDFGLPVLIRTEVLFSQKGYKLEDEEDFLGTTISIEGDFGVNYLDINPLAVYSINDKLSVFAGPSLGLFISGKSELTLKIAGEGSTISVDLDSDDMNGMDFGLIIGGGYNLGMVNIEARYSLGLKSAYKGDTSDDPDVVKIEVLDQKNNVIQIVVGYAF